MNKKIYIVIGAFVVVAGTLIMVVSQNNKETGQGGKQAFEQKRECASVPEDQKEVRVALTKDEKLSAGKPLVYQVLVESRYPVNVVGLAITFDDKALKFVSGDFKRSAFPIQAPTDSILGGMKLNRGVAGEGAGLAGRGEFGTLAFESIGKAGETEPQIDRERTDAFFNNGCAEKAKILIQ